MKQGALVSSEMLQISSKNIQDIILRNLYCKHFLKHTYLQILAHLE